MGMEMGMGMESLPSFAWPGNGGKLAAVEFKQPFAVFLLASPSKETLVGGTGPYLNSQNELTGGVLDVVRTYCDRL
jgi:hypothetical protein